MSEDLLPEGNYMVKASNEPTLGYTKKMIPQVAVMMTITQGDHEGTRLAWYAYFSEPTWERSVNALQAMGWKGGNIDTMTLADLPDEVIAVVQHEEYDGVTRARIAFINDPARSQLIANKMDDDQKRQFAAELKSRINSLGGASTTPEDVPF